MRKTRIAMVFILVTMLASGFSCSDDGLDIASCMPRICIPCGTYVSQDDYSLNIELRDDDTAYLYEGGVMQTSGTWRYDGTQIIINWVGYPTTTAALQGNTIVDNHGTIWAK